MASRQWRVKLQRSRCQKFRKMKSPTTFPPANPWTRPARTQSRASPRAGFLVLKGTTAMLLGCRLRSCGECSAKPSNHRQKKTDRVSVPHDQLRFFLGFLFAVFYRRLEISNALAQAFAQIGQLARSEDKQGDSKNQQEFRQPNFSTKHDFLHWGCPAPKPIV